jgi:hypothetical protein
MRLLSLMFLATTLLSSHARSEIERQHGAHAHGSAELKLALEGGLLEMELTVPGMDLVGFEHAPRDDAQRAAIAEALAFLDAASWLDLPAAAGCTLDKAGFHTHGYAAADGQDQPHADHGKHGKNDGHDPHGGHSHQHDHSQHHAHDHAHAADEAQEHGQHADFHGTLVWHCAMPDALVAIEVSLGQRFPAITRLTVESVTDRGQGRVVLAAATGSIPLPR